MTTADIGALTSAEYTTLSRLATGDAIAYSQDGDDGWFVDGDRAWIGREVVSLRAKGLIKRVCLDEENYRGMSDRDVISDAGRALLAALKEPTNGR